MKIAVTGATGHLGNVLVRDLLNEGHEVRALVRSNARSIESLSIAIVKGSVNDVASVDELVRGTDAVIHCAALISITGDKKEVIKKTNVEGVKIILEAARRSNVKKLVHISSIHAFSQRPSNEPLNETRKFVSDDAAAYDRSKRDGQMLVLGFAKEGLDACVVNPTSIVGPPDYRPSLMGQAIIDLCNGKIPALIPGGFDFADVRDVSKGIINALKKGRRGESYLLSGKWFSIADVTKMLSAISEKKINPPQIPEWVARAGVPFIKAWSVLMHSKPVYTKESIDALAYGNRKIDASKAKRELNFESRPFEETLRDTYNWFRGQGFIKK